MAPKAERSGLGPGSASLGTCSVALPWAAWLDRVQTRDLGSEGRWLRGNPGLLTLPFLSAMGPACDAEPPSALQDYIFYLEPERLESGKGKCPYDPKLDTASALISECPPHPVLQPKSVASAYPRGCADPEPPSGPHLVGRGLQTDRSVSELRGRDWADGVEGPDPTLQSSVVVGCLEERTGQAESI